MLGRHGAEPLGDAGVCLELVFLNGCCSDGLGRAAIAAGVSTVVCWRTQAWDPAARLFATAFFQALRRDVSYRRAYEEAVSALRLVTHDDPTHHLGAAVRAFQLCAPAESVGAHSGPAWAGGPVVAYQFRCRSPPPRKCGCPLANFPLPFPCGEPLLIDANGEYPAARVP